MNGEDATLRTALLDFARELESRKVGWLLGGGYGLYLKQIHCAQTQERTLLPLDIWPRPRATNDLDIFLRVEVVIDAGRMRALREALDDLGYLPVDEAKYLQFRKAIAPGRQVKIDFLVSSDVLNVGRDRLHVNKPRVRPKGADVKVHAYLTEDAVAMEEAPLRIPAQGTLSDGRACTIAVCLPQAFTYLVMKLRAFEDRKADNDSDMGRHHALDLYRIIAMLTESEYRQALATAREYRTHPMVLEARTIVKEGFSSQTAPGALRLREHSLFTDEAAEGLETFLSTLRELFT